MTKHISLIVGVFSIIVLGFIIFFQSPTTPPPAAPPEKTPEEQLEWFMSDKMNYGVRFARVLAEKRLETAEQIARERPALAARAHEVMDSLRARLDRQAKM